MIYDTLNNLPNYLGMSENLDAVIEFVMARDINNLPAGKTRILGEKAVVTVSTVQIRPESPGLRQAEKGRVQHRAGRGRRRNRSINQDPSTQRRLRRGVFYAILSATQTNRRNPL